MTASCQQISKGFLRGARVLQRGEVSFHLNPTITPIDLKLESFYFSKEKQTIEKLEHPIKQITFNLPRGLQHLFSEQMLEGIYILMDKLIIGCCKGTEDKMNKTNN